MIEDFYATSVDDFCKKYLTEKNLDQSYKPKIGGELSRAATELNIKNAEKLNKWGVAIHNRINAYIKRLKHRGSHITIRMIPMEDWRTQSASIVVVEISEGEWKVEIEITIFDDNMTTIKMSEYIADIINKGINRKDFKDRDKVADYVISGIESTLARRDDEKLVEFPRMQNQRLAASYDRPKEPILESYRRYRD